MTWFHPTIVGAKDDNNDLLVVIRPTEWSMIDRLWHDSIKDLNARLKLARQLQRRGDLRGTLLATSVQPSEDNWRTIIACCDDRLDDVHHPANQALSRTPWHTEEL